MIVVLLPLLGTIAWVHALIDESRERYSQHHPKPKPKPVYAMQSSKPRPSHGSTARKRDADFYRDRRVRKAIRKLPF